MDKEIAIFDRFCKGRQMDTALVEAVVGVWKVVTGGGFFEKEDIQCIYNATRDAFKPQDANDEWAVFDGFRMDRKMDEALFAALSNIHEVVNHSGGIIDDQDMELLRDQA